VIQENGYMDWPDGSDAENGNSGGGRFVMIPLMFMLDLARQRLWIMSSPGDEIQPDLRGIRGIGKACVGAAIPGRAGLKKADTMRKRAKKHRDLSPSLPELLMEVNTVVMQGLDDIPDVKVRRMWATTYNDATEALYQRLLMVEEPEQRSNKNG